MDDFKKITYGVVGGFVVMMVAWLSLLFVNACGFNFACTKAAAQPLRTPIPTLIPATLPAPTRYVQPTAVATNTSGETATPASGSTSEVPRPSNSGGPGEALNLTGSAASGAQIFASNCVPCHGDQGKGGIANPGSTDGTVPPLNPIDPLLKNPDPKVFAYNIDLFIQHGSRPDGPGPVNVMPAWGDLNALTQQQIADVIAYLISLNP